MTKLSTLEKFLDIQEHTMFSVSEYVDGVRIIHNDFDQTPFWNYALCGEVLTGAQIHAVEARMRELNRKPAIYFPNTDTFGPLVDELKSDGYQLNNEDSWMFFEGSVPEGLDFNHIKKVSSLSELELWLETLDASFVADDPQNPYGTLGAYIDLARRAWKENGDLGKCEYVIAFNEGKPVAVATLIYEGDLAYISNIGSRKEVRGRGYGKLVTLFCVYEALKNNAVNVCLATEEGTYPNAFYKRIGFTVRFTACNFVHT